LKPEHLTDPALRTDIAGQAASRVGKFADVRTALLQFQKDFAHKEGVKGVVMDGRDIGTVICPDADVKFFVTASLEERANRRTKELQSKNIAADFKTVLNEMKTRDARDFERDAAPLKPAADAHILDTSALDADAAFARALEIINKA
jgi:cytidylate kinase